MATSETQTVNPQVDDQPEELDPRFTISYDEGQCQCGCGQPVIRKQAEFLSGHDAKLKSILILAHLEGAEVHTRAGGMLRSGEAMAFATARDWGKFLDSAMAKHQVKRERREARAATVQANREAREATKAANAKLRAEQTEARKAERKAASQAKVDARAKAKAEREAAKAAKAIVEVEPIDVGESRSFKRGRGTVTGVVLGQSVTSKGVRMLRMRYEDSKGKSVNLDIEAAKTTAVEATEAPVEATAEVAS